MKTKHCKRCDTVKPIIEFHHDRKSKDGHTFYCKDCVSEYGKKYIRTAQGIYSSIKGRNKFYDNHPFKITKKEFIEWYKKQPQECHYCGLPIELLEKFNERYNTKGVRFTIDCKDNDMGYVKGNIVLACDKCNTMKSNYIPYETMCEIGEKYIKPIWESIFKNDKGKPL